MTDLPTFPPRGDHDDRTVIILVVDTPSDLNPDLTGLGPAIADTLVDAGVDPATQAQYLFYTADLEEVSEGWRTGDHLAQPEDLEEPG